MSAKRAPPTASSLKILIEKAPAPKRGGFMASLRSSKSKVVKKGVHFPANVEEVREYRFDWSLEREVFFSREELAEMAKNRFTDAAALRKQLGTKLSAMDNLVKLSGSGVRDLLQQAFLFTDEDTSIRGIEHFVYPQLQQEMVKRKQLVQNEVLSFSRGNEADPHGWKIASQSRYYTKWATNVAVEKGGAYISSDAGNPDDLNNKTPVTMPSTLQVDYTGDLENTKECKSGLDVPIQDMKDLMKPDQGAATGE